MIGRSSKGRLSTTEETVSVKVRLDKTTESMLRECAEELGVPMASVIREGIRKMYQEMCE